MKYVIAHKESGYLYRSQNSRWDRTTQIGLAERLDLDKAENVIKNCISPNMRPFWRIITEEEPALSALNPCLAWIFLRQMLRAIILSRLVCGY